MESQELFIDTLRYELKFRINQLTEFKEEHEQAGNKDGAYACEVRRDEIQKFYRIFQASLDQFKEGSQ